MQWVGLRVGKQGLNTVCKELEVWKASYYKCNINLRICAVCVFYMNVLWARKLNRRYSISTCPLHTISSFILGNRKHNYLLGESFLRYSISASRQSTVALEWQGTLGPGGSWELCSFLFVFSTFPNMNTHHFVQRVRLSLKKKRYIILSFISLLFSIRYIS